MISEEIQKIDTVEFVKNDESSVNNMIKVFSIQSPSGNEMSMRNFILKTLKKMKLPNTSFKVDKKGNILITRGELSEDEYYPCVVAHMDKVFDYVSGYEAVVGTLETGLDKPKIIWSRCKDRKSGKTKDCGGSGDDGCGIYVALEALKRIDKIKVVFTVEEEVGCIGASALDLDFFKDCGYLLQGDRKGSSDLITKYFGTPVCSELFLNETLYIAEEYGFSVDTGTITDVMTLATRGVGISVLNFSVGYYEPHSENEYTIIEELVNSTNFALNLINHLGTTKYSNDYTDKYSHRDSYFYDDFYDKEDIYGDLYYEGADLRDDYDITQVCTCSEHHVALNSVDLECDRCNYTINTQQIYCTCGEVLEDRKYNYYCAVCDELYIKF